MMQGEGTHYDAGGGGHMQGSAQCRGREEGTYFAYDCEFGVKIIWTTG